MSAGEKEEKNSFNTPTANYHPLLRGMLTPFPTVYSSEKVSYHTGNL